MNDYAAGAVLLAVLLSVLGIAVSVGLGVLVLRIGLSPTRRALERVATQLEMDADIRNADD